MRILNYCVVLWMGVIALTGCQTAPPTPKLHSMNKSMIEAIKRETINCNDSPNIDWRCSAPVAAKYKIDKEFKYGRFCGKGHPQLSTNHDPQRSEIENQEKQAIEYYRVEAFDDIDSICREHDVCWTLNPNNMTECNIVFENEMSKLRDEFKRQTGIFDTESTQWRCSVLANDMAFGSVFMKESSTLSGQEFGVNLAKLVSSPLIVTYAGIYALMAGFENYPRFDERCLVSR